MDCVDWKAARNGLDMLVKTDGETEPAWLLLSR